MNCSMQCGPTVNIQTINRLPNRTEVRRLLSVRWKIQQACYAVKGTSDRRSGEVVQASLNEIPTVQKQPARKTCCCLQPSQTPTNTHSATSSDPSSKIKSPPSPDTPTPNSRGDISRPCCGSILSDVVRILNNSITGRQFVISEFNPGPRGLRWTAASKREISSVPHNDSTRSPVICSPRGRSIRDASSAHRLCTNGLSRSA